MAKPPRAPRIPRGSSGALSGSGGGGRGMVGQNLSDNSHHAGPWIVWGLALPVGTFIPVFASGWEHQAIVVSLVALGTAGAGWSVWETTKARSGVARWHALVTLILSGFWLTLVTLTGIVTITRSNTPMGWGWELAAGGFPFGMWLIGGGFAAYAWNHRINAWRSALREAAMAAEFDTGEVDDNHPDKWTVANCKGVTDKIKPVNQYMSAGPVHLRGPGNTLKAVQGKRDEVERAHDWPHDSLTLMPHPKYPSAKRAFARVMLKDPLKEPVAWPGLEEENNAS